MLAAGVMAACSGCVARSFDAVATRVSRALHAMEAAEEGEARRMSHSGAGYPVGAQRTAQARYATGAPVAYGAPQRTAYGPAPDGDPRRAYPPNATANARPRPAPYAPMPGSAYRSLPYTVTLQNN